MRVLSIILVIITAFLTLSSKPSYGTEHFSLNEVNIQAGDVVLVDLNCYVCSIIKDETFSDFSHSGLVIGHNGTDFMVVQSLGVTEVLSLSDFVHLRKKNSPIKVIRTKELSNLSAFSPNEYESRIKLLQTRYFSSYSNKKFDPNFLWDNVDENGEELHYCSEMITKLLNEILVVDISTVPMTFVRNWDYWVEYFNGNQPPEGQPGTSPGSLDRDPVFKTVTP
jgi:hypothetical protein